LKGLRADAGLTGVQLARLTGMSQSKVSKLETGQQTATVADVEALADALRVAATVKADLIDQASALHTEAHPWRARHYPTFRRRQGDLRRMEEQATTVRLFQPNVIPGLLQTAEYARHVLTVNGVAADDMADAIASRVERQVVLYDQGKAFAFLVTEGALRWRLCPTSVHLAAIDRVANLSTLGNVRVGVLPWSSLTPASQTNMFCVLDDRAVLVETMTTELTLKERTDIDRYLDQFERLDALARHDDEARSLLDRIASDLRGLGD
jgi:transcriptional regulator with XRE-family HTH domain